jgi:hypothetical protein
MTLERRREIERLFDGELPEGDRARLLDELLEDPEGRDHLDRLAILRGLARRHDPASKIPRREVILSTTRRPVPWWLAVAATAAAVALLCWPRGRENQPPRVVTIGPSGKVIVAPSRSSTGRAPPPFDRPPLEVELYRWANTPARAPGQAALLVLSPPSPSRKRSPADEILALELANGPSAARGNVRRFAVSRGSKATPPSRAAAPGQRPRAAHPEV